MVTIVVEADEGRWFAKAFHDGEKQAFAYHWALTPNGAIGLLMQDQVFWKGMGMTIAFEDSSGNRHIVGE